MGEFDSPVIFLIHMCMAALGLSQAGRNLWPSNTVALFARKQAPLYRAHITLTSFYFLIHSTYLHNCVFTVEVLLNTETNSLDVKKTRTSHVL